MRRAYSEIEDEAVSRLLSSLPDELRGAYAGIFDRLGGASPEKTLVKAADKLCAYIKCLEEGSVGNREFDTAKLTIEKAMDSMACPELDWFRERLLPSFNLTLDEM